MKNNSKKTGKRRVVYLSIFVILVLCLLLVEICRSVGTVLSSDEILNELLYGIISRGFASLICILMILYCSFGYLFLLNGKKKLKSFLLLIPCWLVAVNNFPFISVINGEASLNSDTPIYYILLFALQCFLVGFFEEVAFRGCVFMLALQEKNKTRKDIFWAIILSSAIFAVVHLANLLSGASPLPVIQQVGYSFLIGAMCALSLIVTKNIWTSIFMHTVFNFAGGLIPMLGSGKIWNVPTIIITAVLAVLVIVYSVILFLRIDISSVSSLFNESNVKKQEG
jgi:membrane protease YdiL (CAAX protease family)